MTWLVVDIETRQDPEFPVTKEFSPPGEHEVITIGVMLIQRDWTYRYGIIKGETEAEIISNFLSMKSHTYITWNGRGFDLPVLTLRALRHGFDFEGNFKRFAKTGHIDMCDYLANYGAGKYSSLDTVAKLCGLPGKLGQKGTDAASMAREAREAYCLCDVVQTGAIFARKFSTTYKEFADRLARDIMSDDRLTALRTYNPGRFLLEEFSGPRTEPIRESTSSGQTEARNDSGTGTV